MKLLVFGTEEQAYIRSVFERHVDREIEIVAYIDSENTGECEAWPSIPQIDRLAAEYSDSIDGVLLAMGYNHDLERAIGAFRSVGITNLFAPTLYACQKKLDFLENGKMDPKQIVEIGKYWPYLVHLETHVVDYCNLNCKGCNNFSSLVKGKRCASPEQFEKDMARLSQLFGGIGRIFLLGGEPLLNPELTGCFMEIARRYFPLSEIRLLTNGLLVSSMKKEFWEIVKKNDVVLQHTNYPTKKNYAENLPRILEEASVKHILNGEVVLFGFRWTEYPFEDPARSNNRCLSAGCHYLRDGRMSKCPDALTVKDFDSKFQTNIYQGDELDIYQEIGGEEILKALSEPVKMCSFCAPHREVTEPWEQVSSRPRKEDWLIEHRYEYENRCLNERCEKMEKQLSLLEVENCKANEEVERNRARAVEKEIELAEQKNRYVDQIGKQGKQIEKQKAAIAKLEKRYNAVVTSRTWRYTAPIRAIRKAIKKPKSER